MLISAGLVVKEVGRICLVNFGIKLGNSTPSRNMTQECLNSTPQMQTQVRTPTPPRPKPTRQALQTDNGLQIHNGHMNEVTNQHITTLMMTWKILAAKKPLGHKRSQHKGLLRKLPLHELYFSHWPAEKGGEFIIVSAHHP